MTILVGLAMGLASGFVHVKLRIPSFVATLATGGVVTGLSLLMEAAAPCRSSTRGVRRRAGSAARALRRPERDPDRRRGGDRGLLVQRYTRFGRYSAAIGAGEPAACASGISVERQKIIAFGLSGGFAALAGVVLAARLSSGSPTSPTSCCCRRSPRSSSAARRSPAASAASAARWSAR